MGLFRTLIELPPLPAMICFFHSGVKLVTEGRQVLDDLRTRSDNGVEIPASGTSPNYHALMDQMQKEQVSNMHNFAGMVLGIDTVISIW
jgi:hypothetical protein